MIKSSYNVIGVMSGTSLDGVDIIYAQFDYNANWNFKIKYSETVSYSKEWKEKLKLLTRSSKEQLIGLDLLYSKLLAHIINEFIKRNEIKEIDFISSHGHTALHRPDLGVTYQIGNKQILADTLGQKIICDFRLQDIELGGQGAPLVPIGDQLLFSDYQYCINLGGFANISFDFEDERIAFDICPVNIVLNHYVHDIGLEFDESGKIASKGEVNRKLLDELNDLAFYNLSNPKSLGLEWVNEHIFPIIDNYTLKLTDILSTFIEHIAIQISEVIMKKGEKVLITGGGAYNKYLISRIQYHVDSIIIIPSKDIIEFKEALIFALLGILKDRNDTNCLASVTGAKKNHSSGKILLPRV